MGAPPLTIWEHAQLQGYTRRDFIKFCGWIAAAAGIQSNGVAQVVKSLDTKPRLPVVWFHFQECTCCSESFIRSSHPIVSDIVLDKISLDYTETLQAAAGKQAEEALHATMKKYRGEYLMLVEGSVPTAEGGIYCCARHREGSRGGGKSDRRLGELRVQRMHTGLPPQSHGRHPDSQDHHGETDNQRSGLPPHRGSHGRNDRPSSRLRPDPGA